jgi:muramoyltetrapeptide carboxypeptidase LdcA involved in peptidoglycan recycling
VPLCRYPPKLAPGDRVAVLSPSFGGPAHFPAPYRLGLRRLRERFRLIPVEFPTTRMPDASPAQRAADIEAAFADPGIAAVIATIGGSDQLAVLPHVEATVLADHPKPFFGYSDNTNLLHLLWRAGVVGYHGGAVMVQWGRPGMMHPVTADSLHRALFEGGWYELPMVPASTDEDQCDWRDPASLRRRPRPEPAPPWEWHGPAAVVEGAAWGGCLEIIAQQIRAGRWLAPLHHYDGHVLFLETSEDMPSAASVYDVLREMGERGLLERFAAVLVGKPKAWSFQRPQEPRAKHAYSAAQRDAILRALAAYNPDAVVVFNLDIGHTDPQVVMPHGGTVRVDAASRRIAVRY